MAGGRWTNGPVWNEDIAGDTGALYMDYAVSGALLRSHMTTLG